MPQAKAVPADANSITKDLMKRIQREYGDRAFFWRNNTGAGVGWGPVRSAIRALKAGNIAAALAILTSRMMSFGLIGSADIIGVVGPHGRFVAIEVKAGDDKQSTEQQAFETRLRGIGAVYILCRDVEQAMGQLQLDINMPR